MRIAVVCANASSNSMVRVYPIARVLARRHRLQVTGFRSGPDVFPPYADEFTYETLMQRRLPAFLGQVRALARRIEADAVLAFKPLASSLWPAATICFSVMFGRTAKLACAMIGPSSNASVT